MRTSFIACVATALSAWALYAQSTIDASNRLAYGANIGWMDWRANTNEGARITEFICVGFAWSPNVGWINLGDGTPSDAVRYSNVTHFDCGVNHLGDGRLSGLAWAANIGWLNFEDKGNPRIDLSSGRMSGLAWSANAGWVSLSNASAHVRVTSLSPAVDSDGDGLPDPWERQHAGDLITLNSNGDADGDGMSDRNEYIADTNPLVPGDGLRIIAVNHDRPAQLSRVEWTSRPTRVYTVMQKTNFAGAAWNSVGTVPGAGPSTAADIVAPVPNTFYQVGVQLPLSP